MWFDFKYGGLHSDIFLEKYNQFIFLVIDYLCPYLNYLITFSLYQSKNFNYIKADVTKKNECEKLVKQTIKKFGKIDILICNVGSGKSVISGHETQSE